MLRLVATFALVACMGAGLACSDDDDNGVINGANGDRDQFIEDAEDRLSNLRSELEDARDNIEAGDASEALEQMADDLEQRINDIESDLDDARDAGDDEWQDVRDSLDQTLNDAENLIQEIAGELGVN